ncbi:MAG: hypothetical protein WCO44_02420 [Bacteroidota bacterium]
MKKISMLLFAGLLCMSIANAQELTSKKGFPILPEKGDIGLSVDAVPFLSYLGNMFHGTSSTSAPSWSFPGLGDNIPTYTFQVKKFTSATTALRARIRIGFIADTKKNTITDQLGTATPNEATVDDKWTSTAFNLVLGAGIEQRRGKGRVQGYVGAMANIFLGSKSNNYTYGNAFTAVHLSPLSTQTPWTADATGGYTATASSARLLSNSDGFAFGIGANAFIGVEYFIAPKISLGGEFSWGLAMQFKGKSNIETETWDGVNKTAKTTTIKRGGSAYFGIDNSNTGGAINLAFYF